MARVEEKAPATFTNTVNIQGAATLDSTATVGSTLGVVGAVTAAAGLTATTGGVTVTAGGLTVTAGRIKEGLETTDVDARSHTLTHGNISKGIVVHTSVTGGGTVTTDTASNIVGNLGLTANHQTVKCYYINDGDQVLTFAGGTGVTLSDAGQTLAENESAILLFQRTGATAIKLHIIGG